MAFAPHYVITDRLLAAITRVHVLVAELNHRHFSHVVLMEWQKTARSVSTHASTSIEGNPLPLTEVKRILKHHPDHVRDSEREVLNYNDALIELERWAQTVDTPLTVTHITDIHARVTTGLLPKFQSGAWRKFPVVVNDPRTGNVVYLPPDHEQVAALMQDLLGYVNAAQPSVDPLIIAGIFHKQFVLIHPFMDGNGRTARLATKILLARMGLNTFNLFSFENYYNRNVTKYFRTVGEQGDYYELTETVDFTSWLEYFADGIIDELLRVTALLPTGATVSQAELTDHHRIILDLIAGNGFVTDAQYAEHTTRARATRHLDFKKLIDLGLIIPQGVGRATRYVLTEPHLPDSNNPG